MKNLTKREKILIYILVYILIIVGGGFLLCMPALEKYSTLQTQYDTIEAQWLTTKAGVVEYHDLDKKIEEVTKLYNEQIKNFYIADDTKVEDVDELITSLAKNHNLIPMSLQIGNVIEEEVVNYEDFKKNAKKSTTNAENSSSATASENNNKTTAKVYIVNLVVSGSITNLQSLVDDARTMKTLKISEVSYSKESELTKNMTVSFKVYMI
ncbi:hypothetical protein ACWG0P_13430 [Amedibacillus sp. YH-ame6]